MQIRLSFPMTFFFSSNTRIALWRYLFGSNTFWASLNAFTASANVASLDTVAYSESGTIKSLTNWVFTINLLGECFQNV